MGYIQNEIFNRETSIPCAPQPTHRGCRRPARVGAAPSNGWGRPVVTFPDDGHPDMCNAVLDVTGDSRDEVVVWDQHEIWVYTQDRPAPDARVYRPVRNPLYNYSNYQASVSLPGWTAHSAR